MPKKMGNGGHGQEEYSAETGRYVSDGVPNKYHNNEIENKILDIFGIKAPEIFKNHLENKVSDALGMNEEVFYSENELGENDIKSLLPKDYRLFIKDIPNKLEFLRTWEKRYNVAAREQKPTTTHTHLINTPERLKFRENTIKRELERQEQNFPKKYERKATLVLGLPASGKSFATKKYLKENGAFEIDGDIFTHKIPEFIQNSDNVSVVHEEAMNMSKSMMDNVINQGANFVMGKVGGGTPDGILKTLDKLQESGYVVNIVFGDLPLEKSLERNLKRYLDGEPRLVPPKVAIHSEVDIFNNLATFLNHPVVEYGEIYNNDVKKGENPKLLRKFTKR